ENREETIKKMRAALEELVIQGIDTNQTFLYMIMIDSDYSKGSFNTSFIDRKIETLLGYNEYE
ncbi:MAG: hypothetical protein RQ856_04660, partial [Candidatus Izemoplasmatales bacterium]|nr:hypothetical protein [Candidatus Izemoplasmatales bacterium]